QYAKLGRALGHGTGGDVGAVLVAGPIEIGVGVNDIGATIVWPDTRRDSVFYRGSGSSRLVANHLQAKTTLPVSYLANVTCTLGSTTLGADALNGGLGTTVHVGGEHRISVLAIRGGVARDPRRRFEFGYGAGLRAPRGAAGGLALRPRCPPCLGGGSVQAHPSRGRGWRSGDVRRPDHVRRRCDVRAHRAVLLQGQVTQPRDGPAGSRSRHPVDRLLPPEPAAGPAGQSDRASVRPPVSAPARDSVVRPQRRPHLFRCRVE